MEIVTIRCRDLMVGDWIFNQNGSPMQIIAVDEDNAYACEGNEKGPWIFGDDEGYKPQPIILTSEILEKNGWKHSNRLMITRIDDNDFYWSKELGGILYKNQYNMCDCKYVHNLQHALRLCGFNKLADNFKV